MSRYHGDQYWTEIQTRARRDWREFNDDDVDAFQAMRHEREVRARDERARARSHRRTEPADHER
ncbi:MAG TPA: hypothetical protein VGH81_13735 [Rudaea sp.]|jgi:hypothetical protein